MLHLCNALVKHRSEDEGGTRDAEKWWEGEQWVDFRLRKWKGTDFTKLVGFSEGEIYDRRFSKDLIDMRKKL